MSNVLKVAISQLGVKEIVGPKHNMTIVNYAKEIGAKWVNDDETPWCAIFMNWVLKRAGFAYTSSARARSFEGYGKPSNNPKPGDIVVFWRVSPTAGTGHVGVFLGISVDRTSVFVLGGNQGNSVSVARYPLSNVLCYRSVGEQLREANFETDVV
jgi:uncharacterized protein (TIGR02594 family)